MMDFLQQLGSLETVLVLAGVFFVFCGFVGSNRNSLLPLTIEQRAGLVSTGMLLTLGGLCLQYPILITDLALRSGIERKEHVSDRLRTERAMMIHINARVIGDAALELERLRAGHSDEDVLVAMKQYLEKVIELTEANENPAVYSILVGCWHRMSSGPDLDNVGALSMTSLIPPLELLDGEFPQINNEEQNAELVRVLQRTIDQGLAQWKKLGAQSENCADLPGLPNTALPRETATAQSGYAVR